MKIANISHNDDLIAVVRKCNANFRELSFSMRQASKKQSRIDSEEMIAAINQVRDDMVDTVIPQQVADQIAEADIPQMVSDEVDARIPEAYPPVGSYIISQFDPGNDYPGTIWQQVDAVTTDGNVTIPLWQRMVI